MERTATRSAQTRAVRRNASEIVAASTPRSSDAATVLLAMLDSS